MSERRTCVGEPLSWLRLERYRAGDLDASARAIVESHLAACPACAECLRQVEADDASPLPSLELPAVTEAPKARGNVVRLAPMRARVGTVLGGLAVAAAAMLGVGRAWWSGAGPGEDPSSPRVKGGDVSFSLVRDDGARIVDDTGVFRSGDRFKVVVTCPPTLRASFDVVVFDEGGPSFPLARVQTLACGNDVAVPGAFRLTGSVDETVCIVWNEAGGPEVRLTTKAEGDLGRDAQCKKLRPAP